MVNQNQFSQIIRASIDSFVKEFINSRKLYTDKNTNKSIHTGSFGSEREEIAAQFLKKFIPSSIGIKTRGFIVYHDHTVSPEQDLIFFNKETTPIHNFENKNLLSH